MSKSIFEAARECLFTTGIDTKISFTAQTCDAVIAGILSNEPLEIRRVLDPGRPIQPRMVAIKDLPRRNFHSVEGHAALMHAIAHIEFNAIDLAWDAIYRFQDLPDEYYADWARIAAEEASHFSLIQVYLNKLGYQYGDFDAHSGLWDMAVETDYDVMVRMALVPRVMEARGLDVTPGIMHKLEQSGYQEAADILQVIYTEEHGHVEVGNKWFNFLCKQRDIPPLATFKSLVKRHAGGKIRKPINDRARRDAGFSEEELLYLHSVI